MSSLGRGRVSHLSAVVVIYRLLWCPAVRSVWSRVCVALCVNKILRLCPPSSNPRLLSACPHPQLWFEYCDLLNNVVIWKHVAIDVLVRSSMKSATKCVMQCDLYDSVSQEIIERILCTRVIRSVCMFQCLQYKTVQHDVTECLMCQSIRLTYGEYISTYVWIT